MKEEERPLVSVIIPSYNRADVIERAVNSVLSQTYGNVEVIIIDDGSSDETRAVVEGMNHPGIRYTYQENSGACAARNRGIELAHGGYVAFQDSDDVWRPDKLEKQMNVMLTTDADVVVCKLVLIEDGERKYLLPKRVPNGKVLPSDDIFGIGTQTVLAKKDVLEKEKFDPALPRLQELEWMLRVMKTFQIRCVDEGLVDYEIRSDSITSDPKKLCRALAMIRFRHPEIVRNSPLLAMHAFKDLMENRKAILKSGVKPEKFVRLALAWFPGVFRYLHDYVKIIVFPSDAHRQ